MVVNRNRNIRTFVKSIWFFPAILTAVLIILTIFQISGSSIGNYHLFFYGNQPDPELIYGRPEAIRSDEWIVGSQKTIAQENNHFAPINTNFGNGEDASLLVDSPYADWSAFFKPHSLVFFVLPFDYAFAMHWWVMLYLVILGCYFFVLVLLPGHKKLAILLPLGFGFSPFLHWWYIYSALATTYCALFGMTVFAKLLQSKKRWHTAARALLLAYLATAFIIVLYPPFQIPAGFVILAFAIGYTLNEKKALKGHLRHNLLFAIASLVVAAAISGIFLYQKRDVVAIIADSAYPGHRLVESGGFSVKHFLSSDLSPVFQSKGRADSYIISGPTNAVNQSESSNFVLVFPFLLLPLAFLAYKNYRRTKKLDYLLVTTTVVLVFFSAWMFIPGLSLFGKFSLLDRVPLSRLILGFGLLNLLLLILFVKTYDTYKKHIRLLYCILYAAAILIFYLILNFHIASAFPGFIGHKSALAFAFVIPVLVFLFMRKQYLWGLALLVIFSLGSIYQINPLYKGTDILTKTPLSQAIKATEPQSKKRWISEDIILENFAAMNGRPSLTGVYAYPQLPLWDQLHQPDKRIDYNRYAHVNFTFTRTPEINTPLLRSPSADQFNVKISPCDTFFKDNNVGFLITSVKFDPGINTCAQLLKTVSYPQVSFYIYKVTY